MKNSKLFYRGGILLLLLLLCCAGRAWAVLEVTYNEAVPIDHVQYYWNNEGTSPTINGRTINPDPAISFDLSNTDKQAKVKSLPLPANCFVFGAHGDYPNSKVIRIRIWSDTRQKNNAFYSGLSSYDNPTAGGNFPSATLSYPYIKAAPTTARITQFTESGTTVIAATPTVSRTVTFASASGQVNNKTVEIGGSKWQLTQGTTVKEMPGSGTSMTLNTDNPPSGITLRSGDKVTIKVKHVNLWDEASENWSDGYDYTVGTAGGSAAPQDEVTLILRKRTADYGINTIALPFKTVYDARGGEVKTLKDLVESLNAAGNGNGYVSTFAYWDPENQREVAFTFNANGGVVDRINATMPLSEVTLERGKGYQVTVTESITVTFRNYQ